MYLRCLLYSPLKLGEGKKKNAPLPASSAGLLRFFEDETRGYKVKPEIILGITGVCHWFVNYNKNNFSSVRRYLIINENDSVTSIHKRWLLTQINPSSYKTSLAISLLASLIVSGIYFFSTEITFPWIIIYILFSLTITTFGIYLDLFLLKGTPIHGLSKVIHVSAFSNIVWAVTLSLGIFSNYLFNKNSDILTYTIEGMFISINLRFGIFVSVFGANRLKSILIALIVPGIFFLNMIHPDEFGVSEISIIFGIAIVGMGVIWSYLADRSGRPQISKYLSSSSGVFICLD